MKTRIASILALAIIFSAGAFGQTEPAMKPKPGPAPKVAFPAFTETTLPNGLKVVVVPNDKQPIVTFRMMIKSGSEFDPKGKSGTGAFVCDLLTKGTTNHTSLEFAKETDFLGVSIGASAADDVMSISGSGLKKHMEKILEMMTDALYYPTFPEEELEKSRKQSLSGLVSAKKDPDEISSRLTITTGFNVHPYANFETESSVKGLTRADLVDFHQKYFIPNNASIAVIGDVTQKEVLPLLKKYFGTWKKGTIPRASFPKPQSITGTHVHLVDLGPTQTQTTLGVHVTGMTRNNPDWVPFSMVNSILGGGFSGRLFKNLRETHAFTYGAYSSPDGRLQAGLWSASASVRRSATDSAAKEILSEIKRIQDEPVSSEELEMHKQYAAGRFLLSLETPGTIASRVQDIDLYSLPKNYYQTYIKRIMATTPADVQRLAKKYLSAENVAITAVGDATEILPTLEKLGTVHVYDTEMKPIDRAAMSMTIDIDVETLLSRHFTASGGADKLAAIKDRVTEGTLVMSFGPQEIKGTLYEIGKAPNKKYEKSVYSLSMGGQEQTMVQEKWNDGTSISQTNPMGGSVNVMEGENLARELEKDQFNDMVRYKELGYTPTIKAKKLFNGKPAYMLEMKKTLGSSIYYIDAGTFLLAGTESSEKNPQGMETTISIVYDDYKNVDGIMLPYTMKVEAGEMMSITMTINSYKQNTGVSDEVFTKH